MSHGHYWQNAIFGLVKNLINAGCNSPSDDFMQFRPSYFRVVSLIILFIAFILSFRDLNSFSDYFHVVIALDPNQPGKSGGSYFIDLVMEILFYGILPIATSLALFIITYIQERKTPIESFTNLLLSIGTFCVVWGILHLLNTYHGYFGAIRMAQEENISYINDSLLLIYAVFGLVGVLWMVTGTLLISTYKLRGKLVMTK
ncbi:MAG: hypothetical protein ACE5J6_03355 [Candidatus Bathyarchaeia archaeon]